MKQRIYDTDFDKLRHHAFVRRVRNIKYVK